MRLLLLDRPSIDAYRVMREAFTVVKKDPNIIYTQLTPIKTDCPVFCPCTGVDHVRSPHIIHLDDKEWLFDNIWATAEHTWALILCLAKHLDYHTALCERVRESSTPMSWDLKGRRLLIVGYGRVGRQVSRYAHAFGMTVDTIESGFHSDLIADKLNRADIVTFHIPLDGNEGMVDNTWFMQMPKGTIVVNTSRSGIFDEDAIGKWSNRIKFGLDTCEDYSEDTIQKLLDGGSIITPHVGGYSDKSRAATDMWIAEKMLLWKEKHGRN
jgi:D-3-phosphoglycerate dehydrogenase